MNERIAKFKETNQALTSTATKGLKNRGVMFAQVYLDSKLESLGKEEGSHLLETVGEWFSKADKSSLNRYVSSFIGPVLDVLGFVRGELQGNVIPLFEDRKLEKVISLCHVVGFDESLDQTLKGKNYAVSIVKELKKTGLSWGILTNGNLWRIYCVREKAPFETFFQIELGKVIENSDKVEMCLFDNFCSAQSFVLDAKNECLLDSNRRESEEATRQIEEHLQDKMEDILGKICMGFIQSEGKKSYTEEQKRAIFDNSIYVLYRLLFILYAEARGFLPVQNPEYYEKSAAKLMENVKEYHCKGIENPDGQTLWNVLCEVFNWVNQGNRALGISPYNGGLFDDSEKPYLANHAINNAYLSEALFSLGFREEKGSIFPINYSDLSVRHLGGFYEGILEYQLFIAPERMVRRKEKDAYRFVPESQAGRITRNDVVIAKGEVYFSQSSEERKLTGSYYTPEYIVRYIVESSLRQYLVKIDQDLEALLNKLVQSHGVAIDDKERLRVERFVDSEILSFLHRRILPIRVLDPAMGSGHFLVNAAYYLTNHIVESLYSTDWINETINTSPLWWRRQVVEKCIFGVDLNELATELAKLSLWLITADNKKPLTFLNHHLRTGNSLLGAKLDDLVVLPKDGQIDNLKKFQTTLYYQTFRREFIPRVLKLAYAMDLSSDEIEDIEKKKDTFVERETLEKNLKIVADTWLSTFFGYEIGGASYQLLLNKFSELKEVPYDYRVEEVAAAEKNRFFHWWLEFPEVFFSSIEGNSGFGFDIVIGNPPYIRIQALEQEHVKFFASNYGAATKNYDIYALFVERGFSLLKEGGMLGFILPSKFINSDYGVGLRKIISTDKSLSKIVNLKDFQVFEGASTYTCLLFLKKAKNDKFHYLEIIDRNAITESKFFEPEVFKKSEQDLPNGEKPWVFVSDDYTSIVNKIKKANLKLGDISKNIFVGLQTSADKLYFVKKVEDLNGLTKIKNSYDGKEFLVETAILRKLLKGKEIRRWQVKWENMFIVYPYFVQNNNARLITMDELKSQFPKAYNYFLNYEIQLRQRENNKFKDEINWHQFVYRKNTEKFEQPKIMTQVLASKNTFTFDDKGEYYFVGGGNAGGYGIVLEDTYSKDYYWVLCLLNSKILEFYLKRISTPFQRGFFSYGKRFIEQLPIIVPSQQDKSKLSELAIKQLGRIKPISTIGNVLADDRIKIEREICQVDEEIDNLVYRIYGINESERKVIETSLNNG